MKVASSPITKTAYGIYKVGDHVVSSSQRWPLYAKMPTVKVIICLVFLLLLHVFTHSIVQSMVCLIYIYIYTCYGKPFHLSTDRMEVWRMDNLMGSSAVCDSSKHRRFNRHRSYSAFYPRLYQRYYHGTYKYIQIYIII